MRVSKHTGKIPETVRDEIVASFLKWENRRSISERLPVSRRSVNDIVAKALGIWPSKR